MRRQLRQVIEKLKLNCGSGESFDAMNARGMNEDSLRRFLTEEGDIDS